jgi:hypothetical protein
MYRPSKNAIIAPLHAPKNTHAVPTDITTALLSYVWLNAYPVETASIVYGIKITTITKVIEKIENGPAIGFDETQPNSFWSCSLNQVFFITITNIIVRIISANTNLGTQCFQLNFLQSH